ncbi:MAG: hypothetical protein K1X89_04735 [Myxococcaceae bacterium]|nr:hypothetical protein [Myxococcaceae bacterium]
MRLALLCTLVSLPVLAADGNDGLRIYADNCSRCHTAFSPPRPGEKAKPRPSRLRAPDLVEVMSRKSPTQVAEWLAKPGLGAKFTGCRPGHLSERELQVLQTWLVAAKFPEPLPLKERQLADLQASVEAEKHRPTPPPGGGTTRPNNGAVTSPGAGQKGN